MELTRAEFEDRYRRGQLSIALIGMSNIGKSFTAKRLAEHFRFDVIEVDQLIWEKLGHDDMDSLAEWQGQPYSPGYTEREKHSIGLETSATRTAIGAEGDNVLLDTAGSVVYVDEDILQSLMARFFVVHVKASASDLDRLMALYFERPKPLVWAGHFERREGRSDEESVLDCYPALLQARESAYAACADQSVSSRLVMDPSIDASALFEALKPNN